MARKSARGYMVKQICKKCGSENIELVSYQNIKCIVCKDCGYDETKLYEVYPEQKTSQKAKARYTPYKAGGGHRTRK